MSGWSIDIEQWDEDGFHGTSSWNTDKPLGKALGEAVEDARVRSNPDTKKLVITIEYEKRPFLREKGAESE